MRRKLITISILLLTIICITQISYAAEQLEATIEISPNVTEVTVGDKVIFTLVTKNIANAVDNGKIYAIGGKIEYDTNFFEVDTTNGITLGGTGLFNSTNAVTEGETNGTITLKVKEGATGSGKVTFSELTASDGRIEDMETLGTATTADKIFTIVIKEKEEPQKPENTTEPEDNTTADKEENKVTNNTVKLPQTGIETVGFIAIPLLGIIAIISYVSYRKYRNI